MSELESVRAALPDAARDIKLNLQSVLLGGTLSPAQRWGVALASAITARNLVLVAAVESAARAEVGEDVIDDARAAAALMAMNNVFYRFRHMVGKSQYEQRPARLRMNRLANPATNKRDFELFSLAASAVGQSALARRPHTRSTAARAAYNHTNAPCSRPAWTRGTCTMRCGSRPRFTRRRWPWKAWFHKVSRVRLGGIPRLSRQATRKGRSIEKRSSRC